MLLEDRLGGAKSLDARRVTYVTIVGTAGRSMRASRSAYTSALPSRVSDHATARFRPPPIATEGVLASADEFETCMAAVSAEPPIERSRPKICDRPVRSSCHATATRLCPPTEADGARALLGPVSTEPPVHVTPAFALVAAKTSYVPSAESL